MNTYTYTPEFYFKTTILYTYIHTPTFVRNRKFFTFSLEILSHLSQQEILNEYR